MRWPGIEGIYGPTLRTNTVFGEGGEKRWEDLHTRVIEHARLFTSYTSLHAKTSLEYPRDLSLLHAHPARAATVPARPLHSTDGRDSLSTGRVWQHLGPNRPPRRHCQLQREAQRGGRDERVELGYGEAVGTGGEELDGHECRIGCTSKGLRFCCIISILLIADPIRLFGFWEGSRAILAEVLGVVNINAIILLC